MMAIVPKRLAREIGEGDETDGEHRRFDDRRAVRSHAGVSDLADEFADLIIAHMNPDRNPSILRRPQAA
jgi:hypothetical protein